MVSTYESMMETADIPVSPSGYGDSQLGDDEVYPCKGCGEILEEGKAFELAGSRWHIDCFRCNTCGTLLDSDANLLLLGDGSLICNNCTYSCNACGEKIEDLAILTGDQAFCSGCFRCRNCKKKIENLRYARTTQGIFCMTCHESVIQKRRKNRNKQKQAEVNSRDKKLPELPPPGVSTSLIGSTIAESSDTSPEKQTDAKGGHRRDQSGGSSREKSPTRLQRSKDPSSMLPSSTFTKSQSQMAGSGMAPAVRDVANELDGFYVPLVLDPNPASTTSPLHSPAADAGLQTTRAADFLSQGPSETGRASRDYLQEAAKQHSRSSSSERRNAGSPQIMQQERARGNEQPADHARKRVPPPTNPGARGEFRLQEAPRSRKEVPHRGSNDYSGSSSTQTHAVQETLAASQVDMPLASSPVDAEHKSRQYASPDVFVDRIPDAPPPRAPRVRPMPQVERPARGDSLAANRKDGQGSGASTPHISELTHGRQPSSSSQLNGGSAFSRSIDGNAIVRGVYEPTNSRSNGQGDHSSGSSLPVSRHVPSKTTHKQSGSFGTGQSDSIDSPLHIPNYFGLDGTSAGHTRDDSQDGNLRKLTNSMRGHTRSASDRAGASPKSQKWLKSPINGSLDLASPTSSVHDTREEAIILRSQLRRAQQRIAELETQRHSLQNVVDGSPEINQVNTALKEKRSTIAILDTQREVVVRELEVMTEHLQKVKDSNRPLDIAMFQSEVLNDFAGSLKKLKAEMTSEIEGLVQKRNDLNDEITSLIQMKDKGFQEYENLSNRNAQLTQHNHELTQSIQDGMRTNKQTNGLGLHFGSSLHGKDRIDTTLIDPRLTPMDSSTTFVPENENDAAILNTTQIVKMKQQKPTMLRKGGFGKTLRGIKGALVSEKAERAPTLQGESIGLPYNFTHHTDTNPTASRQPIDQSRNFRQFFGGSSERNGPRNLKAMQNDSAPSLGADTVPPTQLFGSDLSARCDYEKRVIPCIVSRCVEEVELRGMDAEGVYRKSGGSGQVNQVKGGFEQSNEYDISDPDLEIHAVTSCLKQYLRRLPTPLITYDVYDHLLDAARAEESEKRAMQMRDAVDRLPRAHRDCLEFLIFHLARVTSHEKENLMTTLNLAVVFAPTIMRPASIEREMMDMQIQRQAVQSLIEFNKMIFQSSI